MEMKSEAILVASFIISLGLVSCTSQQSEWQGTVEEVDGVTVVRNPKEPMYESGLLALQEEYVIDTELDEIAETGMTNPENFVVGSGGDVYFQNSQRTSDYHLIKFDSNGNYVTRFGKSGQGPGEIVMSMSLAINKNNEILVVDYMRKELLIFNNEGNFITEKPIDVDIVGAEQLSNGNYLVSRYVVGPDDSKFVKSVCNSEIEILKEIEMQQSSNEKLNAVRNIFMSSIATDSFYISNVERGYEILEFDFDGNLKRKIKKEYDGINISEEYKKQIIDALSPELHDRYYFPAEFPPFQYFFSDEQGRLFVMTYEKSQDSVGYIYDVYDPNGMFMCNISLENYGKMEPSQIDTPLHAKSKNGFIYLLRTKETGYRELVVYRMIWE